jgi:hypothetical protein
VALAVAAGLLLLALTESVNAVVAPFLAPSDADWQAAAQHVRRGYRDRDLIVAAPGWSDQVLRLHLGDLIPAARAGRIDHRGFARVWEISQRGAHAPEGDGKLLGEATFGRLRVRLHEGTGLTPVYDFQDSWAAAQVSRVEPDRVVRCEKQGDQHKCPGVAHNFVQPRILEMDTSLHRALLAQPVQNATVVVEYPQAKLGRELAVGAGLHNAWYREAAGGTVWLRVLVGGKEVGKLESTNRSAWRVARLDTSAWRGQTALVRFEITSAKAHARLFGFAAEARGP